MCSLIEELQKQYKLAEITNPYANFKAPPAADEKFGFEWDVSGVVEAAWKDADMGDDANTPAPKNKVIGVEGEDLLYDLLSGMRCM